MTRRPQRPTKKRPELGDVGDPLALSPLVRAYDALEVRGFSPFTLRALEHNLCLFLVWCEERAIMRATDITRPMVLRYQRWVFHYRQQPSGKPLGVRAQQHRLHAVIGLFRWLTRENYLLYNPATEIELPKGEKRLPKNILSVEQAERVLIQPDLEEPIGVRDRTILEVLYSTGLRRMELCNLGLFDIDCERETLRVQQGKGRKDRMVPIGERAVRWVEKYLSDVRFGAREN